MPTFQTLSLRKEQVERMPDKIKQLFEQSPMLDVDVFGRAVEALTPEERKQLNVAICFKKNK